MNPNPNYLTTRYLSLHGYLAAECERVLGKIRRDAFGFADVVGVKPPKHGAIWIQATVDGSIPARREKMLTERIREIAAVLAAGCEVELWGWRELPRSVAESADQTVAIVHKTKKGDRVSRFAVRRWGFTATEKNGTITVTARDLDGRTSFLFSNTTHGFKPGELGFC